MGKKKRSLDRESGCLTVWGCENINDPSDRSPGPFGFPEEAVTQALCHHWRQPVQITEETVVYASAYMDRPRADAWAWPDVGIYLSSVWAEEMSLASNRWAGPRIGPSAELAVLSCPDGGSPLDEENTERVLAYGLRGSLQGRYVEIGCNAGHGRTGMALATLMILAGLDAEAAMVRVWECYCEFAIESPGQERYLFDLSKRLGRKKG